MFKKIAIRGVMGLLIVTGAGALITPSHTPSMLDGIEPTTTSWFVDHFVIRERVDELEARFGREFSDTAEWSSGGTMTYVGPKGGNFLENPFFFVEWGYPGDGTMEVTVTRRSLIEAAAFSVRTAQDRASQVPSVSK